MHIVSNHGIQKMQRRPAGRAGRRGLSACCEFEGQDAAAVTLNLYGMSCLAPSTQTNYTTLRGRPFANGKDPICDIEYARMSDFRTVWGD